MGTAKGLIARAYAELDYFEKASNKDLDSKTANKGTKNYTKYSRDINKLGLMGCQAQAWCATYQFWLEVQEFGLATALKHWNMTKDSYVGYNCFDTYNKFKAVGRVSSKPKLGCLVIFTTSHMGRVVNIVGDTIWTIEGNTSPAKYDRNGGKVDEKSYKINDSKIKGFCIIDFEDEKSTSNSTKNDNSTKNSNGGGYMFELHDLVQGDKGEEVKLLQRLLIGHGYTIVGEVDGSFGRKTEKAVAKFQFEHDVKVNHSGTVGPKTWKALLGV